MPDFPHRLRGGLPIAVTTAAALLATFGTVLELKFTCDLGDNLLVLAVVLALSLSRRQPGKSARARVFALIALPLVSVGATEIGTQVFERPNLGDALFVAAVSASIWARRFPGTIARLGSIASFPLIAILVAPAAIAGSSGGASSRWWAAVVAAVALLWVTICFSVAERAGWLAAGPTPDAPARSRNGKAAVDRMALRMLLSLTLAFVLGRWLFGLHWTWLVITTFVVSGGGVEHSDVLWRGIQRIIGAGLGTLIATLLTSVAPAHNPWSIVLILLVLMLAAWLRPINYAFWAAGVTSVLALLYGYYGERGTGVLTDRIEAIALGAAMAIAISWLVTLVPLPGGGSDPLRDATMRVLGYVNRRHGLGFRLVRRLPSGGYLVRDADREAILRWSRDPGTPLSAADAFASGATPKGHAYALVDLIPA
ncbi:MAG TPA: FUSC family protein [Frankiaceae bacterium]|nr:FUSC family protein [Frankiaceae bacterium]